MKKNIILLLLLFIICGLYFGINYYNSSTRKQNNISKIDISFDKFSFDKIKSNKIEINNNFLINTGTGIINPDETKITNFINDIKNTKVLSIVSTNKENFDSFGINNSGEILKLGNVELFLGDSDWKTGGEYIQVLGKDKVYLIDNNLKLLFNKDLTYFDKEKIETGTGIIETGDGNTESGTGIIELK